MAPLSSLAVAGSARLPGGGSGHRPGLQRRGRLNPRGRARPAATRSAQSSAQPAVDAVV